MTVRYLAEELYRWTRTVEDLEKTLAALEMGCALEERDRLADGAPPGQTATGPLPGRPDGQKGADLDIIFAVISTVLPNPSPGVQPHLHPDTPRKSGIRHDQDLSRLSSSRDQMRHDPRDLR